MSRALDVTSFMVRGDDGEYDVEATMSPLRAAVETYIALHQNDKEKIETALNGIFERNPSLRANVPALKTLVLDQVWDKNPASFGPLMERIGEVLDSSETIMVSKGPNGGCKLRTPSERAFYQEHGRDQTGEEIKIAKLEAKLKAARA